MIRPSKGFRTIHISLCFLLFCALFLSATSCRTKSKKTSVSVFETAKFDEDDIADGIEAYYTSKPFDDTTWQAKKLQSVPAVMQYVYRSYEYLPLWLNENGNTKSAQAFLEELKGLSADGIDPERYQLSKLKKELKVFEETKTPDINTLVALDTALTAAYLQASHDLLMGQIAPKKADSLWFHANDSTWNPATYITNNLYEKDTYPTLDSFRSKIDMYKHLRKAKEQYNTLQANTQLLQAKQAFAAGDRRDSLVDVIINAELPKGAVATSDTFTTGNAKIASYQMFYGLKPTGKIDTATLAYLQRDPKEITNVIDANLERLRWLPTTLEDTRILVNTALMELSFVRDKTEVMHMKVIVGKNARQTPALNANMSNVVINPSWGVPPTILKKDVLPGMQKSGSAYLAKKDLKVFDHKGNPVDPSQVNASNYKKFVFRQPPGDDNALGYVKFNLPNKWDIYLHDTPHREGFAKDDRAQSSGCIRVEQPQEMALYILGEMEGQRYDQPRLDSVIATQKTRYVNLKNKIPVHIVYLTTTDDGNGGIRFLKDFYKRDARLITALNK